MTLSGDEFKVKYPGPYYKFFDADTIYDELDYKIGLNVDVKNIHIHLMYQGVGLLFFFNDLKHFDEFYKYGPHLGIIEILDDSLVCIKKDQFRADKFILSKIIKEENELLKFFNIAKENGCSGWNGYTCENAAEYGHLEILKWLVKNDGFFDERTCDFAAAYGHLEILKWLRENGCPWNEDTFTNAAVHGHLEILKWLKDNGCPANSFSLIRAINHDLPEVAHWIRKNAFSLTKK